MNVLIKLSFWETVRTIRNRQFIIFSLAMPIIFYIVLTNSLGSNMNMHNVSAKVYFLISMTCFSVVTSSLFGMSGRISFERNKGWLRLIKTTPLSNFVYIGSKILSQLIVSASSTILLFLVAGFVKEVPMNAGEWIISGICITIGSIPFISLGILLGVVIREEAIYVIVNIVNMVLTIVGGMWLPLQMMPKIIQNISSWLPTKHYAALAWDISAWEPIHTTDILDLFGFSIVFIVATILVLRKQEIN